jgi:hypothetical protein
MPAPENVFDRILEKHGIPDENKSYRQGDRPKKVIDAIIRDVKAANERVNARASRG